MKTKKLTIAIALMAMTFIGTSCGNKQQKSASEVTTEQSASSALEIDSLLANAENLAGQEVTIEGVCTHTCKHGAKKIFLMGSDDTKTIRVEAGTKIGSFKPETVNNLVRITGKLVEQRIDEAYLTEWEAQVKAQTAEKHGTTEQGCASEQKARGEAPANSIEERITNFRQRIADRQAKEGKNYLSFYYIEGDTYEIVE
mgnify:CR=1 FL=1